MAQSGSASGLGPEGRRFESCCPDHFQKIVPWQFGIDIAIRVEPNFKNIALP
jgi:hypothetical protein